MKRKTSFDNNLFDLEEEIEIESPLQKKERREEVKYYEITSYPTGGGYGGTSYIKLKDPESSILNNQVTLEILWPNGSTSIHKLTTTSKSSSFYCSDACQTFHDTDVWVHIDLECNGALLKNIKLNEIRGIKARIIDREKFTW